MTILFLDTRNFFSKCYFLNCLLNYVSLLSNFHHENTLKILKKYDDLKTSHSDTLMQTLQPYLA